MKHTPSDSRASTDSTGDHLDQAKDTILKAGEELQATAIAKAGEVLHTAQQEVKDQAHKLWDGIQQSPALADANRYVRKEPVKVLLVAFIIGLAVGASIKH